MTLVIMAAGMGSRYGGLKQLDPLGPGGEFLLDYSIYDAKQAGFDKVVFVIKEENLELFRDTVGRRIENVMEVKYAFQKIDTVPEGVQLPADRVKPWGTAHAVYCCRDFVREPFAVINSDDFYGAAAFTTLASYLKNYEADSMPHKYCMAGYILENTLTENGSVSRGVCAENEENNLTTIVEHTKIERLADGRIVNTFEDGSTEELRAGLHVSMNCWGFTPEFFDTLEKGLVTFFDSNKANLAKCEYYLLTAVQDEINNQTATVKILETDAKWFGVTYKEDRPKVVASIRELIDAGVYPEKLWSSAE